MNKIIHSSILALVLLSLSSISRAVDLVLEGGLHFGGDDVVTVPFTNGDSETIEAGEGISFGVGVVFNPANSLEVQLTYGLKFTGVFAENGDVTLERGVLNALVFYRANKWRIGGGLTQHLSPELDGDGAASNIHTNFDDATGTILEFDYYYWDKAYVGARFTFIDYEVETSTIQARGRKFSGDSIGVVAGWRF